MRIQRQIDLASHKINQIENKENERRNYLEKFSENYERKATVRVTIEELSLEIWAYENKKFNQSYKNEIKGRVWQSLEKAIIGIMIKTNWCNEKECLEKRKYQKEIDESKIFGDLDIKKIKNFEIDVKTWWNRNNLGGGDHGIKLKWNEFKNRKNDLNQWWKYLSKKLQELSRSAKHKNIQNLISEEIAYIIFCVLIGPKRLSIIDQIKISYSNTEFQEKKMCSIGKNGIICPKGGLIWKDKN